MNQYVFVLNEQGERITSFVDNLISKDELLDHAKKEWPDAADYIYSADGDTMLDEFLAGKIYKNGVFVDAPVVEYTPTKAEKINAIKSEYEQRFKKLQEAQQKLMLMGKPTDTIITQYAKLNNEMVARIKEVK